MKISIMVLVISHRHGENIDVFLSRAAATTALAAYCQEYWDEVRDNPLMPEGVEERIEVYFEGVDDEFYSMTEYETDIPLPLSHRETATILAALRYWQREGLMSGGHEQDIASDCERFQCLSAVEIDALCERINCDHGSATAAPSAPVCPICPICRSSNVVADAAARWDCETQQWEVSNVFDKGHGCDNCEASDIEFEWVEVSGELGPQGDFGCAHSMSSERDPAQGLA